MILKDYVEISVQPDLLPQVARELLALAADPNHVHSSTGESGPVLLVHPTLAEAWFKTVANEEVEDSTEDKVEATDEPTEDQSPVDVPVTEEPVRAPEPVEEVVANETVDDSSSTEVVANETTGDSNAAPEPDVQLPVKRGPGRPRKVTSASPSEVLNG